jgi:hypothetical protein
MKNCLTTLECFHAIRPTMKIKELTFWNNLMEKINVPPTTKILRSLKVFIYVKNLSGNAKLFHQF